MKKIFVAGVDIRGTTEEHQKYCFKHFSLRLFERYGIDDLSFAEYLDLINKPFELWYKLSDYSSYGLINIKGQDVMAIKVKHSQCFATCLSPDGFMPVPTSIRQFQIKAAEFNKMFDDATERIKELRKIYEEHDKKTWFVDMIGKEAPYWMYHAAYSMACHPRGHWMTKVIKHISYDLQDAEIKKKGVIIDG